MSENDFNFSPFTIFQTKNETCLCKEDFRYFFLINLWPDDVIHDVMSAWHNLYKYIAQNIASMVPVPRI